MRDGWEPLCRFLKLQTPSCAFPHKNKSGIEVSSIIEHSKMSDRIRREVLIFTGLVFLLVTVVVLLLVVFLA